MKEQWKSIPGEWKIRYEVSSEGRFRAYIRNNLTGAIETRYIKPRWQNGKGMMRLLAKDGKRKYRSARRLVAEAFIGIPEGCRIHAKNRSILDCSASNLKALPLSESCALAGKRRKKTVLRKDVYGNVVEVYPSVMQIAAKCHVDTSTVRRWCRAGIRYEYESSEAAK